MAQLRGNNKLSFSSHFYHRCVITSFIIWAFFIPCNAFSIPSSHATRMRVDATILSFSKDGNNSNMDSDDSPTVAINDFFKDPLPESILKYIALKREDESDDDILGDNINILSMVTSSPRIPGLPRPLWLVILASLPTGLVWYGYYKFCIEEELLQMELDAGKRTPKGLGGYGTLGPFTYGLILGPVAELLHLPGGVNWSAVGIIYIYYTQFLLYERVNELFSSDDDTTDISPPLTVWWCWPIFFPFNLIVGLRQVHFLSQYHYLKRGIDPPPKDPIAEFFPFIGSDNFTWQEFLTKPSLWCVLLKEREDINVKELPEFAQSFLALGTSAAEVEDSSQK